MYYTRNTFPYPYYVNAPVYNYARQPMYRAIPHQLKNVDRFGHRQPSNTSGKNGLKDYGKTPFVVNISEAAKQNNTYRTVIWTGDHLQVALMSINPGEDIGLEVHPTTDQFLRIEQGQGLVQMGDTKDHLNVQKRVYDEYAIMVPAGKWHNVTNTGHTPLKLYSIYAPPEHPFGTIHRTKADAMAAE